MNIINRFSRAAAGFICLLAMIAFGYSSKAEGPKEETFPVLQIGTETYTNVTVTTKAKTYVFLTHSSGMANIRVADMSPEVREKLGYADFGKPKVNTNGAAAWATKTMARMDTPEVKEVKQKVQDSLETYFPGGRLVLPPINQTVLIASAASAVLLYLFFSYCVMLICAKAARPGGFIVWLPIVRFIALLRAANMSPAWFLLCFLPLAATAVIANVPQTPLLIIGFIALLAITLLLAVIATVVWCFKIAKARGKSAWVGLFLLLPVTNLFAFLYLAFSDGVGEKAPPRHRLQSVKFQAA
jgi:hypothetical protein